MQVFIHSAVDVPFYNTMISNTISSLVQQFKQYQFVIKDIANEDEVQFVGIAQRRLDNLFSDSKIKS